MLLENNYYSMFQSNKYIKSWYKQKEEKFIFFLIVPTGKSGICFYKK